MAREENLIRKIAAIMPKSSEQVNKLFESDSEIIKTKDGHLLVSIDEFSAEDHFREDDPYSLGWNMASGAITDILASGGTPAFYLHSMTLHSSWDDAFVTALSEGIADVLNIYGASFLGGDFGTSTVWRYTATVIGNCGEKVLMRSGAKAGDLIYMTGSCGAGNFEALLKKLMDKKLLSRFIRKFRIRFQPRKSEAELIAEFASAAIDSSDGIFRAVNTLAECSGTGYVLENIPFLRSAAIAARVAGISPLLLLFCEAGEYELVFTVPPEREGGFLKKAAEQKLLFHKIGTILNFEPSHSCDSLPCHSREGGNPPLNKTRQNSVDPRLHGDDIKNEHKLSTKKKELLYKNKVYDLNSFSIHARDFANSDQYLRSIIDWVEKQ